MRTVNYSGGCRIFIVRSIAHLLMDLFSQAPASIRNIYLVLHRTHIPPPWNVSAFQFNHRWLSFSSCCLICKDYRRPCSRRRSRRRCHWPFLEISWRPVSSVVPFYIVPVHWLHPFGHYDRSIYFLTYSHTPLCGYGLSIGLLKASAWVAEHLATFSLSLHLTIESILHNPHHVLNNLMPVETVCSYELRHRRHSRELIVKTSRLADSWLYYTYDL